MLCKFKILFTIVVNLQLQNLALEILPSLIPILRTPLNILFLFTFLVNSDLFNLRLLRISLKCSPLYNYL